MAVPLFTPSDPSSTYTDPDTGTTYRFESSNQTWYPVSSGTNQGPQSLAPVDANYTPITQQQPDSGGGALTAEHLRGIGYTDESVIQNILNSPGEVDRFIRELGIGGDPEAERRRIEEEQARIRSGITEAYNPIFSELDRLAGLLPGQEAEYGEEIGNLASSQRSVVESGKQRELANLGLAREQEQSRTKSFLRDLEGDVRNQLSAFGQYIGALGAGNSSAAGQVASVIGREATKARGKAQQGLAEALRTIDVKQQQVEALASEQLQSVEQWKSNKLLEIKQYFDSQLQNLQQQRLQATGQRAAAIANMIVNTEQQFYQRLQQLDQNVQQFKSGIGQWMLQRAGDLEDYKQKLAIQAQYSTPQSSADLYEQAAGIVGDLYSAGAPFGAALTAGQTLDPNLLSGYSFTDDQLNRTKQSSLFDLYNQLGINPSTLEPVESQSDSIELFGIPILSY